MKTVLKMRAETKFWRFGGHFQCILELRKPKNRPSIASTFHVTSELIFIFLESVGAGEWDQLVSQFKIKLLVFMPPPQYLGNISSRDRYPGDISSKDRFIGDISPRDSYLDDISPRDKYRGDISSRDMYPGDISSRDRYLVLAKHWSFSTPGPKYTQKKSCCIKGKIKKNYFKEGQAGVFAPNCLEQSCPSDSVATLNMCDFCTKKKYQNWNKLYHGQNKLYQVWNK